MSKVDNLQIFLTILSIQVTTTCVTVSKQRTGRFAMEHTKDFSNRIEFIPRNHTVNIDL